MLQSCSDLVFPSPYRTQGSKLGEAIGQNERGKGGGILPCNLQWKNQITLISKPSYASVGRVNSEELAFTPKLEASE